MFENKETKGLIGLATVVFGYIYNSLNELVIVLILFMIMDYVLGIIQAIKGQEKFDKWIALWGIAKKLLYGFVIVIGFLVDYIIIYLTTKLGIKLPVTSMFGIAVIAYLLGTEGFSIAKHLLILGIPAPSFLLKFFGLLKDESGKIVPFPKEIEETEDEEGLF